MLVDAIPRQVSQPPFHVVRAPRKRGSGGDLFWQTMASYMPAIVMLGKKIDRKRNRQSARVYRLPVVLHRSAAEQRHDHSNSSRYPLARVLVRAEYPNLPLRRPPGDQGG